tara:strand:+ start:616 stop:798 length:183 start_codon:yes stop_codon:yes gene_type:complete
MQVKVGDLVRYKSETLGSNPVVLVVGVQPGIETMVATVNPNSGFRAARFAKQLEIVSESR